MTGALEGRAAVITGASAGLGCSIAQAYLLAGASVLMCGRDAGRLEEARRGLAAFVEPPQVLLSQAADVSRPEDVSAVVRMALEHFPQVHVLVNNAGVYGPKGRLEDNEWEDWVHAVEINLFGSVLLCRGLLPHLRAHRYGKIIQLSGGGATSPLPRLSAYAASKAAVVRFAETLAQEVREDHIDVNALAPGPLNTRMLDEVLAAGPDRVGPDVYWRARDQKARGGAPLEKGASLAVFLGSEASDGITGKLISAIWDPWPSFPSHLDKLLATDVYTLRRILPRDRGLEL